MILKYGQPSLIVAWKQNILQVRALDWKDLISYFPQCTKKAKLKEKHFFFLEHLTSPDVIPGKKNEKGLIIN